MRTMRIATTGVLLTALVILATAGDAVAAKKKLGRHYGGTTSEGAPFVLELTPNGKAVQRAVMMSRPDCADGHWAAVFGEMRFVSEPPSGIVLGEHTVIGRKVSKSGRFRASGLGSEDFGDHMAAVTEEISGRVRRNGTASGTISFDATIMNKASGQAVTTCSSGELRWTARSKRGVVFAGRTNQGLPAVVELNAQRNTVAHLRFGWGASCTPEGSIFVPDHLTGFRVLDGAFEGSPEQPFTDEGVSGAWSYTLSGRLSGRDASGDIAARLTETDAAGTVSTCEATEITWTARSG